MRWYDYVACLFFANIFAVTLLNIDILGFTIGVFCYRIYEERVRNRING